MDSRLFNVGFKYANILAGILVLICEIITIVEGFTVREFILFAGIVGMTCLFILVNYLANEWIQRYFGFLYAWEGRGCLLIYLGCVITRDPAIFIFCGVLVICIGIAELAVALCYQSPQMQGSTATV